MLILGIPEHEVEAVLASGLGPALPADERCPECDGALRRWGSYRRWVRRAGEVLALRIRRVRCRRCGRTHALLPSFLYARRIDLAEAIFRALRTAASGRGHRPAAIAAQVPETTAREWLRRARLIAEERRSHFAVLAVELGAAPARAPPAANPLAALREAIGEAHRAAAERFGAAAALSPWAFSSAACRGALIANTSSPLAAPRAP